MSTSSTAEDAKTKMSAGSSIAADSNVCLIRVSSIAKGLSQERETRVPGTPDRDVGLSRVISSSKLSAQSEKEIRLGIVADNYGGANRSSSSVKVASQLDKENRNCSSSKYFSCIYGNRLLLFFIFLAFCCLSFIENAWNISGNSVNSRINLESLMPNSTFKYMPPTYKIDVVISWLNASDAAWRRNFEKYDHEFVKDRYALSNEVMLNLLTLTSFGSKWLGQVYILSEQRFSLDFLLPEQRSMIRFVRDSDIVPAQYFPSFNSNVIEMYIHKIKGLSDVYLYLNDDMLLLRPLNINRITGRNKLTIPMDYRPEICEAKLFQKSHPLGHYNVYRNTVNLFRKSFGNCIPWISASHPPYFQSVKINELTLKLFEKQALTLSKNRFRNEVVLDEGGDFSFLLLSNYVGVHIGYMKFSNKFRYHQSDDANFLLSSWTENSNGADFITMQDLYLVDNIRYMKICSSIVNKSCGHLGGGVHSSPAPANTSETTRKCTDLASITCSTRKSV